MKVLITILGALVVMMLYGLAMRSTTMRLEVIHPVPKTVIKYIDLPEEIDVISSDPKHPSALAGWRSQDTLFVYYK